MNLLLFMFSSNVNFLSFTFYQHIYLKPSFIKIRCDLAQLLKGTATKNENFVMKYSPSSCSKPVKHKERY